MARPARAARRRRTWRRGPGARSGRAEAGAMPRVPSGSRTTRSVPSARSVRTNERSRCGVRVASVSSARTRRGAARSCSIVVAAFRASPVLTTGSAGPIESATVAGRGTSAERSAPRSTAVPGRPETSRTVSSVTFASASRGGSPNRLSIRLARVAARTGPSRYASSSVGPSVTPTRASTRPTGPVSSASSSAAPTRGLAPRARPVVVSCPSGATRRIGWATRRAAACSIALRASASLIPPTSTPPIVVPRGIVPRSARATAPNAPAITPTRTTTASTTSSRPRRRRRDRFATETNGPDTSDERAPGLRPGA